MYTRFYVLTTHPIVDQEVYYYKDGYYSHGQHLESCEHEINDGLQQILITEREL